MVLSSKVWTKLSKLSIIKKEKGILEFQKEFPKLDKDIIIPVWDSFQGNAELIRQKLLAYCNPDQLNLTHYNFHTNVSIFF